MPTKRSLSAFPTIFVSITEHVMDNLERFRAPQPTRTEAEALRWQYYDFKKYLRTLDDIRGRELCEKAEAIVVRIIEIPVDGEPSTWALDFIPRDIEAGAKSLEEALRRSQGFMDIDQIEAEIDRLHANPLAFIEGGSIPGAKPPNSFDPQESIIDTFISGDSPPESKNNPPGSQ